MPETKHSDLVLAVAHGRLRRKDNRHWNNKQIAWWKLLEWVDDPANSKEQAGSYVLGRLAETTVQHRVDGKADGDPCTDLHRNTDAVVVRSAVTLDADYPADGFLERVADLDLESLVHTTYASTPTAQRYRVILPSNREMKPDEYVTVARWLMQELGASNFDPSTWQPQRFMYKPAASRPEWFDHWHFTGDLLNVDAVLLDAGLEGDDEKGSHEPLPHDGPTFAALSPTQRDMVNQEVKRLVEWWRAKLADAAQWDEGQRDKEGRGWESLSYQSAWAFAKIAAAPWTEMDAERARELYLDVLPGVIAADPKCRDKWNEGVVLKAAAEGTDPPPWARDFEPWTEPDAPTVDAPTSPLTDSGGILSRFSRLSMAELLDPDRPPREYLVEPMIAVGTSVALVAPAGHRKSLLLLRLALAVARGDEEFAGMVIPRARRVLYVDLENTEDDLRERLQSFGVTPTDDLDRFILVSLPSMEPLDTAKGGEDLLAALDAYSLERGDLVVLDSYQRVTQAGENDSDTTRGYYRHTGMHLKARGLTVIRTDNTGKDVKKGARGSSGKRDDVDVEYLIESKGDYIEVNVGKARQRGVSQMSIYVTAEDGRTQFRSDLPSPAKRRVSECVTLLDGLGVPEEAGERRALAALKSADDDTPPRTVVRDAVKVRQNRAVSARRAFADEPSGDTAPLGDGAVRRGED